MKRNPLKTQAKLVAELESVGHSIAVLRQVVNELNQKSTFDLQSDGFRQIGLKFAESHLCKHEIRLKKRKERLDVQLA